MKKKMMQMTGLCSLPKCGSVCYFTYKCLIVESVLFCRERRPKKRLIYPGKPITKKKKKTKDLSKLEETHSGEGISEQPTTPDQLGATDEVEEEKTVRKSTRTAVIVRQAEREAIRAAMQATTKVSLYTDVFLAIAFCRNDVFLLVTDLNCTAAFFLWFLLFFAFFFERFVQRNEFFSSISLAYGFGHSCYCCQPLLSGTGSKILVLGTSTKT